MSNYFSFIWDVDPMAFNISNFFSATWVLIFSCVGLLFAFELLLYINKKEKVLTKPLSYFLWVATFTLVGAKLLSLLFAQGEFLENLYNAEFSITGGFIFLIFGSIFFFWNKPNYQAQLVDIGAYTFLGFLFLYYIGATFSTDNWGQPTNSSKGFVFVEQAQNILVGVFDKIESVKVKEMEIVAPINNRDVPLTLELHFIQEVLNKEDATNFLNTDFKNTLLDYEPIKNHFTSAGSENGLNFELLSKPDGRLQANILVGGVARHPISIYKAILVLVVFLLLQVVRQNGIIKYAGQKAAWLILFWTSLNLLTDYLFSAQINLKVLSDFSLNLLLLAVSIYFILNAEKLLVFQKGGTKSV